MSDDKCCNNRQNFGHPDCGLGLFSNISRLIFAPLKNSSGTPFVYALDEITNESMTAEFVAQNPSDRLYGFPTLENFVWAQADSLKEDVSSGASFFLREGVISITGQLFERDATPTMKGKVSGMRCAEWGVFFVTKDNQVIGATKTGSNLIAPDVTIDFFIPIPISSQSVDGIFTPTMDGGAQKIMFAFNLDRNFDTKNLYMIEGDKMNNNAGDPAPFDFLDVLRVVDCRLDVSTPTTTTLSVGVADDYRQGYRADGLNGNVTGLVFGDFILTDKTTGIAVPISAAVEAPLGVYALTHTLVLSGHDMEISLALAQTDPTYNGSQTYLIP